METSSFFLGGLEKANGKFELSEIIGEGTYGEVYRGISRNKKPVAIKVIENSPSKHEEIQIEMEIFQKYSRHPNIVNYIGTFLFENSKRIPNQIWIIMEYCEGRSVAELAKVMAQNGQRLSENIIGYIVKETLTAIAFLHKHHVVHRDIKGPNILLTIDGFVRLIDFGVSAQLAATMGRRHSSVGSPFWMAPEVIACEQQLDYSYNNRCDIWSLGITAIELADGDPPYAEEHPMRALFKIPRNPPPTVRQPRKWSKKFLNFLVSALTKDFEVRPSAQYLLDTSPFLLDVDEDTNEVRKELMSRVLISNKNFAGAPKDASALTLLKRQENAKRNVKMLEQDDLASLPKITEDIILNYIQERYAADQIYTYIGEILIAVNPFKELQIYSHGATMLYQDTQKENLPPHIFMVACTTYQSMIHKGNDQCLVISGESGSGKTMSANFLVHQLASIGKSNFNKMNKNLVKKILQVNPLMEAFGNAQTVINSNSSRFGKLLELHFTSTGSLVGAQLSDYLLEKSRVVSQPRGERNFHMLYYMIAGLDFHKKLKDFELNTTSRHRYLNTDELSLAESACTSEKQVKFTQVQQCFEVLGFSPEEIQSLYCLLASVIHLGDVEFTVDDFASHEGEKAKIVNQDTLITVASLLCVDKFELNEALTTNSSVTRGETITRNNNVEQAMDCRDATAKALYGRLFSWIVKRINTLLRAEDRTETLHTKIGILDIFGFENCAVNSFEQLCINIANEQLQFYFNEHVFVWEYEEYAQEDIKGVNIPFKNNKELLDLFLQKPVGLLALLDEESRFPKASDLTLVEKFQDNLQSTYMRASKETSTFFTINHYAGQITYDATGFLEKNRDTLSADIIQTLRMSNDKTITSLFSSAPVTKEGNNNNNHSNNEKWKNSADSKYSSIATNRFQQTVSTHFRQSLRSLLSKVIKSDPHFVRCIRPNIQNTPDMFDDEKVLQQLQYTGVLETCKIRQKGYSERILFRDFISRYKFLMFENAQKIPETGDICDKLLVAANIDEDKEWRIGKTKVFLRYYHAERLSKCFERYRNYIIIGQKAIRFWLMRRKVKQFSDYRNLCASKIRAQWLAYRLRKRYLKLREEERSGNKKMTAEDLAGKRPEVEKTPEKLSKKKSVKDQPKRQHKSLFDRAKNKIKPTTKLTQRQKMKSLREYVSQVQKLNEQKKKEKEEAEMNDYEIVEQDFEAFIPDRTEYLESKIRDSNNKFRDEEEQQYRPYFRNVKRERRGYDDYEEFYSHKQESTRKDLPTDPLSKIPNHKYKKVKDPEGQAALEETRAIILLSQIELASKEALEMLSRTSYPVIHSVREKAAINAGQGLKNQKLDHKDRQIAVVDGFGDPLQQKYRLAKFHYAKSIKDDEVDQPEYPNAPMLGLVEKPRREKKPEPVQTEKKEPTQKQPIKKQKQAQQYKPANNKLERKEVRKEKRVPKPKAVDNGFSYTEQNYYPSRNQKSKPVPQDPSSSEWFYPGRRNQNLLEEKKMIDNRLADKEKELREQRKKYQDYNPAENHYVTPKNLPWKVHEDYRPYNYLLNDRVDPKNVFGHDNINHSPIGRRKQLNQYNHAPNPSKQVINQPPSFNERKKLVQSRPPQPLPKKEKQQTPLQVFYPSRRRVPSHQEYEDTNWFEPTPLPGLATSPYPPSNINPTSTATSSDYYDYRDSDYRPKKKKLGFNYGLNQDNILHDLKLKKTGRLQELLVK